MPIFYFPTCCLLSFYLCKFLSAGSFYRLPVYFAYYRLHSTVYWATCLPNNDLPDNRNSFVPVVDVTWCDAMIITICLTKLVFSFIWKQMRNPSHFTDNADTYLSMSIAQIIGLQSTLPTYWHWKWKEYLIIIGVDSFNFCVQNVWELEFCISLPRKKVVYTRKISCCDKTLVG